MGYNYLGMNQILNNKNLAKKALFVFYLILAIGIFAANGPFVLADNFSSLPYVPGGPHPGDIKGVPDLISYIYNLAFWLVGLAVFVQVIRGGLLIFFFAAGNASKISEGRSMIFNAVIGFVLLVAAYLILNVINPDLVKNTFNFGGQVNP